MYSLAINSTYTTVEAGLFCNDHLISITTLDHKQASKELMLKVAELFAQNGLSFSDLAYIAAYQGPGPFTTLRVAIASVNGLGFATQLPLLGIDGFDCFLQEHKDGAYPLTIALFNAFSGDVYYALQTGTTITKGSEKAETFLSAVSREYPTTPIRFIGSGVTLHKPLIEQILPNSYIPEPLPQSCSLSYLGTMAFNQWQDTHGGSTQLLPLYLKSAIMS